MVKLFYFMYILYLLSNERSMAACWRSLSNCPIIVSTLFASLGQSVHSDRRGLIWVALMLMRWCWFIDGPPKKLVPTLIWWSHHDLDVNIFVGVYWVLTEGGGCQLCAHKRYWFARRIWCFGREHLFYFTRSWIMLTCLNVKREVWKKTARTCFLSF